VRQQISNSAILKIDTISPRELERSSDLVENIITSNEEDGIKNQAQSFSNIREQKSSLAKALKDSQDVELRISQMDMAPRGQTDR